jgi:hypothetical protein
MGVKVYFAGPATPRGAGWKAELKRRLGAGFDPCEPLLNASLPDRLIVERSQAAIAACDFWVAHLDHLDIPTAMEALHARTLGKTVLLIASPGAAVSPWLSYHVHRIFSGIAEAAVEMKWLAGQTDPP